MIDVYNMCLYASGQFFLINKQQDLNNILNESSSQTTLYASGQPCLDMNTIFLIIYKHILNVVFISFNMIAEKYVINNDLMIYKVL